MQGNWREKYNRYKSFLLNTVDRYEERTDVRVYLEILLSLATISVFAIFALRPTLLTIAELIKEIEAKEELVDKLDSKIETITAAQIIYDKHRNNIELLKDAVPQQAKIDHLIYQLEGLVEKNNLRAQSIAVKETPLLDSPKKSVQSGQNDKESSESVSFDIKVRGDYVSLFSFITDVENLLRPIKIINTTILAQQDEETEEIFLSLTLSGDMPYNYTEDEEKPNQQ
jgi:hypothetical protein